MKQQNTFQKLRMEKLRAEINLLENQLEKEKEELSSKKSLEKIKMALPAILTGVSILAGLFSILFPSLKYIEQKKAEYQFRFNNEMVQFVSDLGSPEEEKREQAIMMLSYYEKDAIPILLFKLERTKYRTKSTVVNALKNIEELSTKSEDLLIDLLLKSAQNFFERGYQEPIEKVSNKEQGLLNYIFALGELGNKGDDRILEFLSLVRREIENSDLQEASANKILDEIKESREKLNEE